MTTSREHTVWVYWEGKRSPLIDLCIQTIERNCRARVIGPAEVAELGGKFILDETTDLPRWMRSDLLRFWLLHRFGGIWIDADTICMNAPNWPDQLPVVVGYYRPRAGGWGASGLLASPFGACKGSPAMQTAFDHVRGMVAAYRKDRASVKYGATSVGVLSTVFREHRAGAVRFEHWRNGRVHWDQVEQFKETQPNVTDWEIKPQYVPHAETYHLTNKGVGLFRDWPRERLKNSKTLLSFLLKKAFREPPCVPGRSQSYAEMIPAANGKPLQGVEVGVMQGRNLHNVLFLRPDIAKAWGVDIWSGVYMGARNRNWSAVFEHAKENLRQFGERCEIIREFSTAAAERFEPGSLDFAIIDATHDEPDVQEDLETWVPKIRPGGTICGHDYSTEKFPGVVKQVNELSQRLRQKIRFGHDTTWALTVPNC